MLHPTYSLNINYTIKIVVVFAIALLVSGKMLGQNIGINTDGATPDASAMLDIVSTSKGLLIPRVALTATNAAGPVTSPATSLLVYNTATAGVAPNNVIPGYYYWNGIAWIAFNTTSAASTAWTLGGNTGITSSHFVGTSDDKALIFKSNNQSFLEFGNRGTLGLTQSYADYDNASEKVTYIRSALQFEASAAQFYKPKMFTDVNGNFRVKGSAAGTDYFEFGSTGASNNGGFEFIIGDDGDEPIVFKSYHYINGMSEIMRLQSGRMAVGSNAFDATNPEKLLIDAGTTTSYNLMTGKGSINNYLQINVKNSSSGGSASSDLVASSDNGTESVNYIDMGINSSGYNNTSMPVLGGANTGYLYSTGTDFVIGNATASKPLRFFTGGTANSNERMRIDGNGKVGIANLSPSEALDVTGNVRFSGALMPNNSAGTSGYVLQSNGSGSAPTWVTPSSVVGSSSWTLDGNTVAANRNFGTISNYPLPFITNNTEKMRLFTNGSLALGATSLDVTNPEKLLVDAGTTSSFNVISGKGTINNYLQLNIQNRSTGTSASSDVVASANNATESVNYIDMGINSSGYTNTSLPVLGGINTAYLYSTGNDFVIGNATANKPLRFFTGGTATTNEAMRIDGDGYVMIGTDSNNGEKLLVDAGTDQTAIGVEGDVNNYLEINVQNTNNGNLASSDIVATANNGSASTVYVDLGINSAGYSNGQNNILNGPNVAYLYAHGRDFKIGNGTPNRDLIFFTNPSSGTLGTNTANGVERMRITEAGKIGINTNNPSYTLHVDGDAAKPGGGTWTAASDGRLKKDIKPFNDGLDVLTKINPVWFQYNGVAGLPTDGKNYVGIIAQEMQAIAPYTIGTFKDDETNTEYLNYDANAVTYILINAVQEQQAVIDLLKTQLEEQNQRLLRLEEKLK
ncbi:tail fiber domain-containing protein [Chryseolinea sp. H1M3-3]|uniref:tail fiber domain-containing protein n=1 Tax=Chryseolinea sp. H1M3-3 TaxID=3034144 RepID=UPI0023EC51B5|nr:tail fiber domain-containing protein [Chryseolinea sp. H1M3-3]